MVNGTWWCRTTNVEGRIIPKKKKKHFQLSLFSLLISQKHDEKDSFYESVDKLKTLLTNVKWHLRHSSDNTNDWRQNNSEMKVKCLFQSSFLNKALKTTELEQKRQSSASFRQGKAHMFSIISFARQKSLEPLAASPEWQSHVPKICADGAASFQRMHRLEMSTQ